MTNDINPDHRDALLGHQVGRDPAAIAEGLREAGLTGAAVAGVIDAGAQRPRTGEPGGHTEVKGDDNGDDIAGVARTLPGYHERSAGVDTGGSIDPPAEDGRVEIPNWLNPKVSKPAGGAVVYNFPSGRRLE